MMNFCPEAYDKLRYNGQETEFLNTYLGRNFSDDLKITLFSDKNSKYVDYADLYDAVYKLIKNKVNNLEERDNMIRWVYAKYQKGKLSFNKKKALLPFFEEAFKEIILPRAVALYLEDCENEFYVYE